LKQNFSLERISKVAAIFNLEKLNWMNGVYIRALTVEDLACRAMPFLEKGLSAGVKRPLDGDYVRKMMPLIQERAKTLAEVPLLADFFFFDVEYDFNLLISKGMTRESTLNALDVSRERLSKLASFDAGSLEALLRPLAEELGLKTGQLFGALRTAVTGKVATPPLFQTMEVLGRERCLNCIKAARDGLHNLPP
jgi:glutamyl-tRNA synthetase